MNAWVTKLNEGIAWAAFQSARSGQVTSPSHKGKTMAQVRRGVTSPPSMAHAKLPAAPAPSFPAAPMHSPPSAPVSLSSTLQSMSAAAAYAVTAPPTLHTQEALPVAAVATAELLSPTESVPPTPAAQLAEKPPAPVPARTPATRSGSQASTSARSQPVGATTESSSRTSSVAGRAAISSDVAAAAAAGRSTPPELKHPAPVSSEARAPQSPPLPSRLSESSPAP